MRLTILGSSGSVPAPGNPASGYLVSTGGAPSLLIDLGPGVLAALEEIQDPTDAHVLLSHLHADHCADFPSLMVWRRFHPDSEAKSRNFFFAPSIAPTYLGRLSADDPDGVDDLSDTFAFSPWQERTPELIDRVTVTPFRVIHPVETYALRVVENSTGKILTYSGDTAYTEALIDAARDADVFLCEATWGDCPNDKAPGMHISGQEAGEIATLAGVKKLVITHIPPWVDPDRAVAAAAEYFDGPIVAGRPRMEFEI